MLKLELLLILMSLLVVAGGLWALRLKRQLRGLVREVVATTRDVTGVDVTAHNGAEMKDLVAAFEEMVQAVRSHQAKAAIDADVLHRRENEWRNLVQNSPMVIIKVDRDLTIRFANRLPGGEGTVAWTGGSILELVAPEDRELYLDTLTRAFAGRETVKAELRLCEADNSTRWHEVTMGAIGTSDRVREVLQISHDISERRCAADA